jgi:hypothetical protein
MQNPLTSTPSSDDLKKFGWSIGGVFLLLGAIFLCLFLFNGKHVVKSSVCLSVGAFLVVMGTVPPLRNSGLMLSVYRGWLKLAAFLARYVGHYVGLAVFALIYWVLFTPVSLVMRVVRFDPLGLRKHGKASTYWHDREFPLSSDHYEKQFAIMEEPSDGSKNDSS